MTQEIKLKLEQAAHKWYGNAPGDRSKNIFKHGAQTILENPQEWRLTTKEDVMAKIKLLHDVEDRWRIKNDELKSQLAKYREALERIATADVILLGEFARKVAKEALKQGVNND